MLEIDELEEAQHHIEQLEDYILYREGDLRGFFHFYTMMNCDPITDEAGDLEWQHMYESVKVARERMAGMGGAAK